MAGPTRHWGTRPLLLGQLDEARRLAEQALEGSQHQRGVAGHAFCLLGDIATHPDRFDAVNGEAQYRHALALAEARGMRPLVAHCRFGLGRLCRRTGNRAAAHEHLATATGDVPRDGHAILAGTGGGRECRGRIGRWLSSAPSRETQAKGTAVPARILDG